MMENTIYKIVLTGGPCGGKTTGQARLCTFFENLGWKVFRVPETASILLSGGVKFADLSDQQALDFQSSLLHAMMAIERAYFQIAESFDSHQKCLIVCDRGTMDASAFVTREQWREILTRNNITSDVDLRDNRYHQIVHLVSAANGAEDFYSVEDHSCRSEDLSQAIIMDNKAAQAWVGHPYFDVIDNSTDFDAKIRRLIACVCCRLGIETGDRLAADARKFKFLVRAPLPAAACFPQHQDFDVVHHYLIDSAAGTQTRLRKRGQHGAWSYTHTNRKPEKLGQRVEVRTQVSHRGYTSLLERADPRHLPVYKTRRAFLHGGHYFQLDIYQEPHHARCRELMLLETYSTDPIDRLRARLPPFLDVQADVTGRPEHSMFNLSLREDWNDHNFCRVQAQEQSEKLESSGDSNS